MAVEVIDCPDCGFVNPTNADECEVCGTYIGDVDSTRTVE